MSTFVIPHCSSSIERCLVLSDHFLSTVSDFSFPPLIVLVVLSLILSPCKFSWTITLSDVTAHVAILNHNNIFIFFLPICEYSSMLYSVFLPIYFFAVNLKIFYKIPQLFYRKKQDRITKYFGYFLLWLLIFYDFT